MSRQKNQQTWRYDIKTYAVWGTERKDRSKVNLSLRDCGRPSGGLLYASWESQKEKRKSTFEEIIIENFLNLMKDIHINIQDPLKEFQVGWNQGDLYQEKL